MTITNDSEFPYYNWYIKINDNNRALLNNYRKHITKYSDTDIDINYRYMCRIGSGTDSAGDNTITTKQFKEYVLKEVVELNIDYSYLIDVFKKYKLIK